MKQLHDDIIIYMVSSSFGHMHYRSILTLRLLNRKWNSLVSSNAVWGPLIEQAFPEYDEKKLQRLCVRQGIDSYFDLFKTLTRKNKCIGCGETTRGYSKVLGYKICMDCRLCEGSEGDRWFLSRDQILARYDGSDTLKNMLQYIPHDWLRINRLFRKSYQPIWFYEHIEIYLKYEGFIDKEEKEKELQKIKERKEQMEQKERERTLKTQKREALIQKRKDMVLKFFKGKQPITEADWKNREVQLFTRSGKNGAKKTASYIMEKHEREKEKQKRKELLIARMDKQTIEDDDWNDDQVRPFVEKGENGAEKTARYIMEKHERKKRVDDLFRANEWNGLPSGRYQAMRSFFNRYLTFAVDNTETTISNSDDFANAVKRANYYYLRSVKKK
ncbi:hypothetical protein BKA69DRAFT_350249 [Paraphysoderma sedebokerense]|nr:hypothetical protein BKA69DRAFT_350249 [Paraphysoderma sedebokerense]